MAATMSSMSDTCQPGGAARKGGALPRTARATWLTGLVAGLLISSPLAHADTSESAAQTSPRAVVSLVSESATVAPGQAVRIGLWQKLTPRWHTYWRNPGDAGTPPDIQLNLPAGASASEIAWPGPDALAFGPLVNFGYDHEVLLPITVTLPDTLRPGDVARIEADASWLVCANECIPEEGHFTLELPVAEQAVAARDEIRAAFARSDARLPVPSPWPAEVAIDAQALTLTLEGEGIGQGAIAKAFFFPFDWGVIEHAAPQALTVNDGHLQLSLQRGMALDPNAAFAGLLAVSDAEGNRRWLELTAAPAALGAHANPATVAAVAQLPLGLGKAALFAFLGGLILNLMPCVFPVLAMKAMSVAQLSGGELKRIRLAGLFYTLGVLTAFALLAAALLTVRAGGSAVGWGFQFQSPWFVTLMAWLLLLIGLNLSGVFEIGARLAGAGQSLTEHQGYKGTFFTGLLAVVVATPCTAPFMGAALGTALAAPPLEALALFLAMGLGLALPYALLGVVPQVARWLPRPGLWMVRLRQALAFLMYPSAAWLAWVLAQQAGDLGVLVVLAGAVLVALAAWLYGLSQQVRRRAWLAQVLGVLVLASAVALLPLLPESGSSTTAARPSSATYEAFSAKRLAQLRAEGRPVFVNMTAAWCISCLVNERVALSTGAVQQSLKDRGITYLKGDWTNRDREIGDYLRGFGRDGLPFYAFYPAAGQEPEVLPPVLSESLLLSTFSGAATP